MPAIIRSIVSNRRDVGEMFEGQCVTDGITRAGVARPS